MDEEFRHHLHLRTEDLVRQGVPSREAARRARLEFGHVESHKEDARAARGLRFLDEIRFSWLDVKLALRNLVKHPGVTIVVVSGLALGIPVGLLPIHAMDAMRATLPFPEGERVVGIRYWDTARAAPVFSRSMLHDLTTTRAELRSFEDIGAAVPANRNLATAGGDPARVAGAAVTASTFELAGVPPLLGRLLTDSDETDGAANVVVIGYDVWRSTFAGEADVIGRTADVGGVPHTVVGVMPEGFRFPVSHDLWIPLRVDPHDQRPERRAGMLAYGRLADGVSADMAQAELAAVLGNVLAERGESDARLRPDVVPYWRLGFDLGPEEFAILGLVQMLALLLLLFICANIGTLILARTAGRTREIAIRTAIGGSRTRIVSQLFLESFVLALLATGIGLFAGHHVASRVEPWDTMPFWIDFGVNARTIVLALTLAAISAVVAGVLPAMRVTGRGLGSGLQATPGSGGGIRFGRFSTVLIVGDVAVAVLLLFVTTWGVNSLASGAPPEDWMGIRPGEFVVADVGLPPAASPSTPSDSALGRHMARRADVQRVLVERLQREPAVRAVAVARDLPGAYHRPRRIEVEGEGAEGSAEDHRVREAVVDIGFFDALERPIIRGRDFVPADLQDGTRSVIVNEKFADQVLGGSRAVGRRIRYPTPRDASPNPWYEIVGVVGPLGMNPSDPADDAAVYRPARSGTYAPRLAIQVVGSPAAFIPRLRQIAYGVDPLVLIENASPLPDVVARTRWFEDLQLRLTSVFAIMCVVFSATGIHALMSFLVSRRTREIGIRAALGARPRQIVWSVGRRALGQLALGVAIGFGLALPLSTALAVLGTATDFSPVKAAALVSIGMISLGMIACLTPTLRALRVQPTEALTEGE